MCWTSNGGSNEFAGIHFCCEHDGVKQRGEVKELLEEEGKFLVEFVNEGEERMSYNDLINLYDKWNNEGESYWSYQKIIDHRRVKGGRYQVKVFWDTGEETWEPMQTIKEDDKLTLAAYAREMKLLDESGWK